MIVTVLNIINSWKYDFVILCLQWMMMMNDGNARGAPILWLN